MASEEEEYQRSLKAVRKGDQAAKTKLAWFKLSGLGGADVDVAGAVVLLEERVRDGDSEAMWMLGVCNEFGIGVKKDEEQAVRLYCQSRDGKNQIGWVLGPDDRQRRRNGYLKIERL